MAGVPMCNFGPPARFKACIDDIVPVGRIIECDEVADQRPADSIQQAEAGVDALAAALARG